MLPLGHASQVVVNDLNFLQWRGFDKPAVGGHRVGRLPQGQQLLFLSLLSAAAADTQNY